MPLLNAGIPADVEAQEDPVQGSVETLHVSKISTIIVSAVILLSMITTSVLRFKRPVDVVPENQ